MTHASTVFLTAVCAAAALSGCVVAPVSPPPHAAYVAPPGVVYVAPTYAVPGPGYAWRYHGSYGWGWYHADRGWHRGWR
ncbi:MAG: hypothetical protein U1E84_10285 [Rhodoferax sp.]